jgi:hypothetical protein
MFNCSIISNLQIIKRIWLKSSSTPGKVEMESRHNREKYYLPTKNICIFSMDVWKNDRSIVPRFRLR